MILLDDWLSLGSGGDKEVDKSEKKREGFKKVAYEYLIWIQIDLVGKHLKRTVNHFAFKLKTWIAVVVDATLIQNWSWLSIR